MKIPSHSMRMFGCICLLSLASCMMRQPAPANLPGSAKPASASTVVPGAPTIEPASAGLESLEKVDDYPLYTMRLEGQATGQSGLSLPLSKANRNRTGWGCSLFAALGDPANSLYGRNFDWEFSPALLLYYDPPQGYASLSMVDLAYLGFTPAELLRLDELTDEQLQPLLQAPGLPFDGMNEKGLVVGMAAVEAGGVRPDPSKETLGSLGIIRRILDQAATVDEAVAIFRNYNIDWSGGPPLHYLAADASGKAVLVEFSLEKMEIIYNDGAYALATNFLVSQAGASPHGQCVRYDAIQTQLAQTSGRLTPEQALDLLDRVSQEITQWSVVYEISAGQVRVVMGREYGVVHTFELKP